MTKQHETDPNGKSAKDKGSKLDDGKSEIMSLALGYFPRALGAVAKVSRKGAIKYSPFGWQTVPGGVVRYTDAMGRHLAKEFMGQYIDSEFNAEDEQIGTLEPHAAQVAWNALARLELILAEKAGEEIVEPPEWAFGNYSKDK